MGSLSDKLEYLLDTKEQLKSALIDKSVDIDENTTFRNFAIKTTEDTGLVDTSDANAVANKIIKGYNAYVNGQKIEGSIVPVTTTHTPTVSIISTTTDSSHPGQIRLGTATWQNVYLQDAGIALWFNQYNLARSLGIQANILKNGSTVLGVRGSVVELNGQTKNITPSLNPQIIEPDEGYNGITVVNIDAVTSNIDPNISAENIKNGVNILGVVGNLNSGIDTSDATAIANDIVNGQTAYVNGVKLTGTINIVNVITDTDPDNFMIQPNFMGMPFCLISGKVNPQTATGRAIVTNNTNLDAVVNHSVLANGIGLNSNILKQGVNILGVVGNLDPSSGSGWSVPNGLNFNANGTIEANNWNFDLRSDLSGMFYASKELINLTGEENWDVSNVVNTSNMFYYCQNLTDLDVSNWNTSSLVNASYMFYYCQNLTSLDVSNWNTSNVIDMSSMFSGCSNLINLNVSNWDVSNVTYINTLFSSCNITNLDVSSWNTSKVINMAFTFSTCKNLTNLDVSSWNTSNVTDLLYMFRNCNTLTNIDVSNWDVSNVITMDGMFRDCQKLKNIDISNWNINNGVTNIANMFYQCKSLSDASVHSIINMCLNATNVTIKNLSFSNLKSPFYYAISNTRYQNRWSELTAAGWTY